MAKEVVHAEVETPQFFPMSLGEYAVNVNLDPLLEGALRRWVSQEDRLKTEWDAILAAYRVLPIR